MHKVHVRVMLICHVFVCLGRVFTILRFLVFGVRCTHTARRNVVKGILIYIGLKNNLPLVSETG